MYYLYWLLLCQHHIVSRSLKWWWWLTWPARGCCKSSMPLFPITFPFYMMETLKRADLKSKAPLFKTKKQKKKSTKKKKSPSDRHSLCRTARRLDIRIRYHTVIQSSSQPWHFHIKWAMKSGEEPEQQKTFRVTLQRTMQILQKAEDLRSGILAYQLSPALKLT